VANQSLHQSLHRWTTAPSSGMTSSRSPASGCQPDRRRSRCRPAT
jgi:hypothetical protein